MSYQSAEDKQMEENYFAAMAALKMRIIEREQATEKAKCDDDVASAIGDCASNLPDHAARGKLLEVQSMYKSADSSGKDRVIKHLSEAIIVKTTIGAAITALTALSLVGIAGLSTTYLVADQYGNMHETYTVPQDDGTVNFYTDMNDNDIPDAVQAFRQEPGSSAYVPDGPSHDPGIGEASSDFWDVIVSLFS